MCCFSDHHFMGCASRNEIIMAVVHERKVAVTDVVMYPFKKVSGVFCNKSLNTIAQLTKTATTQHGIVYGVILTSRKHGCYFRFRCQIGLGPVHSNTESKSDDTLTLRLATPSERVMSTIGTLHESRKRGRFCAVCLQLHSNTHRLKKCVACKSIEYCSIACQRKGWKTHKPACLKLRSY